MFNVRDQILPSNKRPGRDIIMCIVCQIAIQLNNKISVVALVDLMRAERDRNIDMLRAVLCNVSEGHIWQWYLYQEGAAEVYA
jgi:hypothetical protein